MARIRDTAEVRVTGEVAPVARRPRRASTPTPTETVAAPEVTMEDLDALIKPLRDALLTAARGDLRRIHREDDGSYIVR